MGKRIIVLAQCDDYQECLKLIEAHSKILNIPLNLRELEPYKGKFLSFDKDTCEKSGKTYPCYQAREMEGSLGYLSIEESRHYKNLPVKNFSIVALLDKKESSTYKIVLNEIRKNFPKAMDLQTETEDKWEVEY
jgi:hypothetical protein